MILSDTNTVDIAGELNTIRLHAGSVTLGRVITLIVVVPDAQTAEDAIETAAATSRAHPCRVVVIVEDNDAEAPARLDAEIRVGESEGASEIVILFPHGAVSRSLDSLVMPLLLSDTPIVAWWPTQSPNSPGEHPLGLMAQRRITDARRTDNPVATLQSLGLNYRPGDTDLSWAAITSWRSLAVTLVEEKPHAAIDSVIIRGDIHHPSLHLIGGWFAVQLQTSVQLEHVDGAPSIAEVIMDREDGRLSIRRDDDANVAYLAHPNRVEQRVNLPERSLSDCLTEDLRCLDPDDMYAHVITRGIAMVER